MKQCYVSGPEKSASAKKAWATRRARFGVSGGNTSGPSHAMLVTDEWRASLSQGQKRRYSDPVKLAEQGARIRSYSDRISLTLKSKYANGSLTHWADTDQVGVIQEKLSQACKDGWKEFRNTPEYKAWKIKLLATHSRRPSGCEKLIQSLNIPNLEYTGDSNFWVHLFNKDKNPDFVVRPFHVTHRVVELLGAMGYYHHESEVLPLINAYAKVGVTCLVLREVELKDLESLKRKLLEFVHVKPCCIGGQPTKANTEATCESRESVTTTRKGRSKRSA